MPRSVPPKGMRIFHKLQNYCLERFNIKYLEKSTVVPNERRLLRKGRFPRSKRNQREISFFLRVEASEGIACINGKSDNRKSVVYRDMPCGTRNGVVGTGRGNTERAGTRRSSEGCRAASRRTGM